MPYDELTDDRQIGPHNQEELIRTHCSGLEERLQHTRSRVEAEQIFREACARFDQSCESSVVRRFLKQHAAKLFENAWGEENVISADTPIEDLVTTVPDSVTYLMKKGIKCLACGEPVWGTLGQAAREKGFTDQDISGFVEELRRLANDHAR